MTVVFWDIDGTLLTTGRAGVFALEDACRGVAGQALELHTLRTDGLTDHQIACKVLEQAGMPSAPALVERFLRIYENQLPHRLPLRRGRVLDGVREILSYLRAARSDVHSMLLTGNTAAGARAKLAHYGLLEFFEGGAFSQDTGPRAGIAKRALEAVQSHFSEVMIEPGHLFVVGDTPYDIECGQAIGARTVAVASGAYSVDQLRTYDPWWVCPRLPEPEAFVARLDGGA